jgi:hypothetical protein
MNITRTTLQTLREGASYVQFEHKMQSLYLAGVDIGSMNHSKEFIRGFMESMATVMDRRMKDHVRVIDPITGRKRVFAFMADKVTELHWTGDAVVVMIMSAEGGLQDVFADYLLATGHTGEALMGQIYDETLVKKLGLTPAEIREQCTGTAFDGAYFHLNSPDHLAKRIVENAKRSPATRPELRNLKEWLLCTWDPAHRLELVANDIRVDKLGVDVELDRLFLILRIKNRGAPPPGPPICFRAASPPGPPRSDIYKGEMTHREKVGKGEQPFYAGRGKNVRCTKM